MSWHAASGALPASDEFGETRMKPMRQNARLGQQKPSLGHRMKSIVDGLRRHLNAKGTIAYCGHTVLSDGYCCIPYCINHVSKREHG